MSETFDIEKVQGLTLGLSAGAVAVSWVVLSPLFAASLAAGAVLEAANFRSLRRSCQTIFQSGVSGSGAAASAFGLRFVLLAAAVVLPYLRLRLLYSIGSRVIQRQAVTVAVLFKYQRLSKSKI